VKEKVSGLIDPSNQPASPKVLVSALAKDLLWGRNSASIKQSVRRRSPSFGWKANRLAASFGLT